MFQASFHSGITLLASLYAPPDTGVPNLQLAALEYLLKIEGADQICWSAPFCGEVIFICSALCRGGALLLQDAPQKAPLPGADSPYQGEMSRRDKRGRDAGSAQPRLRGCWKFAMKPKPQIQFTVWKGRNEHRG